MPSDPLILVLNAGSSSLKLAAFVADRLEVRAGVERTNHSTGVPRLWLQDGDGCEIPRESKPVSDRASALRAVLDEVAMRLPGRPIAAVGHRVVHGGDRFTTPARVTPDVLTQLETLVPLAPLHQPHNLAEIRVAASLLPEVPQVACFDTAFHVTMPKHEQMIGLPRAYFDKGVKRYGFHGLSYESIAFRLPVPLRTVPPTAGKPASPFFASRTPISTTSRMRIFRVM